MRQEVKMLQCVEDPHCYGARLAMGVRGISHEAPARTADEILLPVLL